MEPKIVFEDEKILVLEKPAGMVVNRAQSVKEVAVQDWAGTYLKIKGRGIGGRAGIVHRIDKETSGLLLVAKTPEAFENLQKQFKEREVEKKYIALVHGLVEPSSGEIRAPLRRLPWNRERFGVLAGGREARSKYQTISSFRFQNSNYTLLELKPETGRTHQIRVHLKYWGHPIIADDKYAGRKTNRRDREWCPRLFLHAAFLAFAHPETGKRVGFESPLPEDLKTALSQVPGFR